jgi:rod shape determining protein RodA
MDPTVLYELWNRFTRHIDGILMAIVLLLLGVGLITLYSALYPDTGRFFTQIKSIVFALVVMWAIAQVPPQKIALVSIPLYVIGLALLALVLVKGVTVNGSQRWLAFHGFRFQPSEIMKIAMPLILAWLFQKLEGQNSWGIVALKFIGAVILILLPVELIRKEPDLGTALLVTASGFYVLYLARLPWKLIISFVVAGIAAVVALFMLASYSQTHEMTAPFMHSYQMTRILSFVNSIVDPAAVDMAGAGYHTAQAKIAIGSGGVYGKGWMHGTQTHLDFLPEHHTDFIIAAFSEEFGLIGVALLLALFAALLLRMLIISTRASTLFERLLSGSLTLVVFTYIFVNVGMVSGVLPVVGVPLPFISYGGTSMLSMAVCMGILMSIHSHRSLMGGDNKQ